jgi:DeoR/GlpR family transcriptional regulator of sugar metabolism
VEEQETQDRGRRKPPKRDADKREEVAIRRYDLMEALGTSGIINLLDYSARANLRLNQVRGDALYLQRRGLADFRHGQIRRLFGQWVSTAVWERYSVRRTERSRVASAIVKEMRKLHGKEAARTIVVGPGSASCEVALEMAMDPRLRVFAIITPSLLVVDLLRHTAMSLKVAGGELCAEDAVFHGKDSVLALESQRIAHAGVMGFSGLDGDEGRFYCTQEAEVATLQACLEIAEHIYWACDARDKLCREDAYVFGSVEGLLSRPDKSKRIHVFHPQLGGDGQDAERTEYLRELGKKYDNFEARAVPVPGSRGKATRTQD